MSDAREPGPDDPTVPAAGPPPARDEPRFPPGTEFAERYRVVSVLGSGGMGEVYRADDRRLAESVTENEMGSFAA